MLGGVKLQSVSTWYISVEKIFIWGMLLMPQAAMNLLLRGVSARTKVKRRPYAEVNSMDFI